MSDAEATYHMNVFDIYHNFSLAWMHYFTEEIASKVVRLILGVAVVAVALQIVWGLVKNAL